MAESVYCENADCPVEMFTFGWKNSQTQNCPSCGQFGRLKDEKKSKADD